MLTNKRTITAGAALVAITTVSLLAGCNGGAQNIDPAGKTPGASAGTDQDRAVDCTVVGDAALQALTKASSKGRVAVAYARKTSGGWYVAGPVGDNTSFSSVIGLWATRGDVTSSDFDSTFFALNSDAQKSTDYSTPAPSTFTASSATAQNALGCARKTKS